MFTFLSSKHRPGRALLLAALALAVPPATAQQRPPETEEASADAVLIAATETHSVEFRLEDTTIRLADAVARAVERDPRIALFEARRDEVSLLTEASQRWFSDSPSVSLAHTSDAVWSEEGYRQWDAILQLPLWWPGQRRARGNVAKLSGDALAAAKAAFELSVASRVRDAIAAVVLARTRLEQVRHELEVAEALARDVERAVALGERARLDWLAAREVALGRREAMLEEDTELIDEIRRWQSLTGLEHIPAHWQETPAVGRTVDPGHPLLVAVRERVERSEAELALARRDRWAGPDLALGTQHERGFSRAPYNNRLVAGLRVPIGHVAGSDARIAEARIGLGKARTAEAAQRRALELELHEAIHGLEAARRALEVSRERAEVAAESQSLARRSFDLGETGMADFLRAQARAFAAERQRDKAVFRSEYAIARLNQALGVIP